MLFAPEVDLLSKCFSTVSPWQPPPPFTTLTAVYFHKAVTKAWCTTNEREGRSNVVAAWRKLLICTEFNHHYFSTDNVHSFRGNRRMKVKWSEMWLCGSARFVQTDLDRERRYRWKISSAEQTKKKHTGRDMCIWQSSLLGWQQQTARVDRQTDKGLQQVW